jgi:hypothetical protein
VANYRGTVLTPRSQADAWRYLADLRSTQEWDPSVENVRLTSGEPGEVGSRYELEVEFLSRRLTLPSETVVSEPPDRVVFRAETSSVVVLDEATMSADGAGSAVTWNATLTLKGLRKALEPLLRIGFSRIGRQAEEGLREKLAHPASEGARS